VFIANHQANPNGIIFKQLRINQFPAKQYALAKVPTQVGLKIYHFILQGFCISK
jgi:hypothetical protein